MFQCSNPKCQKTFPFAAKQITHTRTFIRDPHYEGSPAAGNYYPQDIERYVCPHCSSPDIAEINPLAEQQDLQNVEDFWDLPSTDHDQIKKLLDQGFVLKQSWQKNVHLVKYRQPQQEGDYAAEAQALAENRVVGAIVDGKAYGNVPQDLANNTGESTMNKKCEKCGKEITDGPFNLCKTCWKNNDYSYKIKKEAT